MDAPLFNFHDIILFITAALCLIFVILRFVVAGANALASTFLSLFFIALAASCVSTVMLWNEYLTLSDWQQKGLPYLLALSATIKGPALWLYVRSLTEKDYVVDRLTALHALPAVLVLSYTAFMGFDTQDILFNMTNYTVTLDRLVNGYWYFIKTVPVLYGGACVVYMFHYRTRLKARFSEIPSLAPNWLNGMSIGFGVAWTSTLVVSVLGNIVDFPIAQVLGITDNYLRFALVIALFVYSMSYAQTIVLTPKQEPKPLEKSEPELNPESIRKVEDGISDMALHLKANINIEQFSERVDLPVRETSLVINKHFGTNFFEFINLHRVDEAKQRLANPQCAHLSIMEIYLECGFNSSSAFQRFFKRFTGTTPSAYRKQQAQTNQTTETS